MIYYIEKVKKFGKVKNYVYICTMETVKKEIGLSEKTIKELEEIGYTRGIRQYYDKFWYDNVSIEMDCMYRHVKNHMGGNYGRADEYIIVNQGRIQKMQYYGDGSATFEYIMFIGK